MGTWSRRIAVTCAVVAAYGMSALSGCGTPPAAAPGPQPAGVRDGWTLQFTDAFQRSDLGKDWSTVDGGWYIEKGMLSGHGSIMCARKFPGAQRLEFDAVSDTPCDLTGLIGCNEGGYESGYFFGFGSENNALSKLLIQGGEAKQYDALIKPGQLHHVICERDGKELKHTIDGKVVMTYTDATPLTGPDHAMIGFYIYTAGKIGNVKVFTKPEPK